jgi:hypothetical protein
LRSGKGKVRKQGYQIKEKMIRRIKEYSKVRKLSEKYRRKRLQ